MAIGKRVIALIVMTLITTATPAVYQIGIEPRVGALSCQITITSVELDQDYTTENTAYFKAYLRIENTESVDVVLSQLTLDVYYYSSNGRYEMVGTMNTTQEYEIPANGVIQSSKQNGIVTNIYPADNDRTTVMAKLCFYQDEIGGVATTEAMAELISGSSANFKVQGSASTGPVDLTFSKDITLYVDFWDPNFVIVDIFPYLTESDSSYEPEYTTAAEYIDSGLGKYVIHTRMHNPSGIPFVINSYNFSLVDSTNQIRAKGIDVASVLDLGYDPDVKTEYETFRATIGEVFKGGLHSTTFTSDGDEWQDLFIGVDFNDYEYPNPDNVNSETRNNTAWFFNKLLTDPVISDISLQGTLDMVIGWYSGVTAKGVSVQVGSDDLNEKQFKITNVNFYQQHYDEYDGETPVAIQDLIVPGQVEVNKIDIQSSVNEVTFDMSSVLNFTNPYRYKMDFTDFDTSYYRIDENNVLNYDEQFLFGEANAGDIITASINPAERTNSLLDPVLSSTSTLVPHTYSLTINTETYSGTTGISKVFTDMGISDDILSLTDPFELMGPDGVDVDPLVIMEYLISNGLDPLMHLNSTEVTYDIMDEEDGYFPLDCMFFGSRHGRSYDEMQNQGVDLGESNDLAQIDQPDPSRNGYAAYNRIVRPYTVTSSWGPAFDIDYDRQWEFASKSGTPSYWEDSTNRVGYLDHFNGLISPDFTTTSTSPASGSMYPDDMVWRVYQNGATAAGATDYDFGYWYDWEGLLRNYYVVVDASAGSASNGVAFCQDFQLLDQSQSDAPPINLDSDDVIKASLSISYRYPISGGSSGLLGIGNYTTSGSNYYYDYTDIGSSYICTGLSQGLRGQSLTNDGSKIWQDKVIDITDYIKMAIDEYQRTGDANKLKFEVAFGTAPGSSDVVYFDDVQVYIEYRDPEPNAYFDIADLFDKTEEIDEINGNMWNMLSDIAFDPSNFAAFLGNDPMVTSDGNEYNLGMSDENANLVTYLAGSGVDLSEMTNILENDFSEIDASEPTAFLEMLNASRYIIDADGGATNVQGYGYRDELDNYWVIEDPYEASKYISDTISNTIHIDPASGELGMAGMRDEELWMMFDNLDIYMPWVIMYLMSHGWSSNDVFDALEALGFASEAKENYDEHQDSRGWLQFTFDAYTNIETGILWGLLNAHTTDEYSVEDRVFSYNMSQTVSNGIQELFRYLFDRGQTHYYLGDDVQEQSPYSRTLISSASDISGQMIEFVIADKERNWGDIYGYCQLTPTGFSFNIWMEELDKHGVSATTPDNVLVAENPYVSGIYGAQGTYAQVNGLNDVGSQTITSLVRANYKFEDQTFLRTGGDPIGLFQFLDNYFFGEVEVDFNGDTIMKDYSSYTILDYFNVKSTDFIDLITGYNWVDDNFDGYSMNNYELAGDGLVNDWKVPLDYGNDYEWSDSANTSASLNGWGNDGWDGRIYWNTLDDDFWYNGHIIWSDSPSLMDIQDTDNPARVDAHEKGLVYDAGMISGDTSDDDAPWEGAPPCVNLIDMLCWLSKTTGAFDSNEIFEWIIGELPLEYYTVVQPVGGDLWQEYGPTNPGIGNDQCWGMLYDATFNVTGMFNYLENIKGADPYSLLYELQDRSSGSPNPTDLSYWALNPDLVISPEGHVEFIYHDSLGATTGLSQRFLWQLYNGSYWAEHGEDELWDYISNPEDTLCYLFFERIRDLELNGTVNPLDTDRVLEFNLFNLFSSLHIDSIDWWNDIQYSSHNIAPLNVLYASDKLNLTQQIRQAGYDGESTTMLINGTFNLRMYGFDLTDPHNDNTLTLSLDPKEFTAAYHFANFIDPYALVHENFIIE